MKHRHSSKRGQTMTEYIIIVVVVALAAIAIVAAFSDTVQSKFRGATEELGGTASSTVDSKQYLKDLGTTTTP
jgi:Flp pilus assembly pilin Flp